MKVYADASLVFPLIVAETFAKDFVPPQAKAKEEGEKTGKN